MPEVIEKRTRSSKTHSLGEGKFSWDGTIGSIHYEDNGWQEIDNYFEPAVAPWGWQMLHAGYHIRVKEDFTAGQIIEFEKQGETVQFQPMALEWTNDLDQIQPIAMPHEVNPVVSNPEVDLLPAVGMPSHQGTIRWNDAYGEGLDFEWKATSTRLVKILEIENFNKLIAPEQYILDGGNPVLRLNLIFDPSNGVDIYVDDEVWDKKAKKLTFKAIEFRKDGEVLWGFMPLRYWGSGDDPETNQGQSIATLEKRGNKLYISIRVPYDWLTNCTFPVFIDTDVNEQVENDLDDAFEDEGLNFVNNLDYMWVNESTKPQAAGMRFTTVPIDQGLGIIAAKITIRPYSTTYDDPNCDIYLEAVDDALNFDDLQTVWDRPATAHSTEWIDTGLGGNYVDSPDITDAVQDVISRGGWVSNNALCVIVKGKTSGTFIIWAHEKGAAYYPKLHIEYSPAAVGQPYISRVQGVQGMRSWGGI